MIKVAVVAGKIVESLVEKLETKDLRVEKAFVTIEELWNDVLDNVSDYNYIDKIIVVSNGLIPEKEMPLVEQVMNLQSMLAMGNATSDLYFALKDADLYEEIKANPEDTLIFRNTNILLFKELNVRNMYDVLKGSYDAKGIYHPDFLRKNEIDAELKQAYYEADTEYEPVDKTVKREIIDEYIDEDEDVQKKLKEIEREERKNRSKNRPDNKPKKSGFGRKRDNEGGIELNQEDGHLKVQNPKSGKKSDRRGGKSQVDYFKGILAFTGDRQSGVSTTIANTATFYAEMGYNVLVIDLDMKRRSQSVIFKNFKDAIDLDTRVAHGLLVCLANPKNLQDVVSVVENNISILSIDTEVEREIKKFANKPIEQLYSASNVVNLLSFAKSNYDIVLIDFPFEVMKRIGGALTYVDRVILCIPNTEHHLNTLLEVELEDLLLTNDLIGSTLISKSSILLTKYNQHSKIFNKEATDVLIERILNDIDDPMYHLEVLGIIPMSFEYEKQMSTNKRIITHSRPYEEAFTRFIENIK